MQTITHIPKETECAMIAYDWGFILKRHVQQCIILDYCFDKFHQTLKHAVCIESLQTALYVLLKEYQPDTNSLYDLLAGHEPWTIISSEVGAFSLVLHVQCLQTVDTQDIVSELIGTVPVLLRRYLSGGDAH